MRIRSLLLVAMLVSLPAMGRQHASASQVINDWAVLAFDSNLADARDADLRQCMKSLPGQLDLVSQAGPFPSASEYAALVSWGVGWMTMSLGYAAVDDRGEGRLISDLEETVVAQKVPAPEVRALLYRLSRLHERYGFTLGVQDGGCDLLIISDRMGTRAILLPPGWEVSSEDGDPREIFRAWLDQRVPRRAP